MGDRLGTPDAVGFLSPASFPTIIPFFDIFFHLSIRIFFCYNLHAICIRSFLQGDLRVYVRNSQDLGRKSNMILPLSLANVKNNIKFVITMHIITNLYVII